MNYAKSWDSFDERRETLVQISDFIKAVIKIAVL